MLGTYVWIDQFLGRLHPLVVHFPIGLLVMAAFLEFLEISRGKKGLREGITWLVYLGALSSVFSVIFGLLLEKSEGYSGNLIEFHLKAGITTTVLALAAAWLLYREVSRDRNHFIFYRIALALSVISLTVTGHVGANLTHGEDYLSSVLPWNGGGYDDDKAAGLFVELTSGSSSDSLSQDQLDRLNLEVRAIFAHNCYQCHSEHKKKGGLVLESEDYVKMGGESGPVIVPGSAAESEMVRRLTLPADHDEVMPKKGKKLKSHEIDLITLWIDQGAHWADGEFKVFPEAPLALTKPSLPEAPSGLTNPVDKLVNRYFETKEISWPEPVADRIFARRAYLDIVGLLPSPGQLEDFTRDTSPEKRKKLVRQLLDDNENYAQHWLSFWNDLLRNDYSGTGFITGGRQQITGWLYNCLEKNKPYDSMVMQLIDPVEGSEGFIRGIQWRGDVNASESVEMQAAQNIGQSLMGVNLKCASCHNSFISNLSLKQTYNFANIFADTVLELYRCGKPTGVMAEPGFIYPELGTIDSDSVKGRLVQLSKILVKPENGRLYRTITNRLWGRLMGRGIIARYDEMDNIPWDQDLLDWLAAELIDSNKDIKHLLEVILTSRAYQLPAVSYARIDDLRSDEFVFQGPVVKRLSAEQFADAVSQVIYPVYKSLSFDPSGRKRMASWIWQREIEFDRDVLPLPGKRFFRYTFSTNPGKEITGAMSLATADHSFTMYVNGKKAAEGSDWKKVSKTDLSSLLQKGQNTIAFEAENEGPVSNPAGILFTLRVSYADGTRETISSNSDWKCTREIPPKDWLLATFDDSAWENARGQNADHWGNLLAFRFDSVDNKAYARSSLVKLDPFLKVLGRPTRENVATSRDDFATLLQSLELTNGEFFNGVLEEGAGEWLSDYGHDSEAIAENLYMRSFGRNPTKKEKEVITSALGEKPDKEAVQDLFWATLLLPEFQLIY